MPNSTNNKRVEDFFGIAVKLTGPVKEGPNYRVSILVNPLNKGKALISTKKRDKDPERALELARETAGMLIIEHKEEIIEMIKEESLNATLALYYYLRKQDILYYADHDVEPDIYNEIWSRPVVQETLGKVKLLEPLTEEKIGAMMNIIFRKKTRKDRVSDDEKRLWALVSDIYSRAFLDGIVDNIPEWKKAETHKKSLTAKALERMSRQSFSVQETIRFMQCCLDGIAAGKMEYGAILLCMLTGMSFPQVCALDWADWHRREYPPVSWLNVTKELHQDRKYPPYWVTEFKTPFGFHRVVCTDFVEHILYEVFRNQENLQTAMFTAEGRRLEPYVVRKAFNLLLDQVVDHGGRVAVKSRNRMGRHDDRQITNGDFLRANYEHYMRTYCGMDYAAFTAYMGKIPDDTYARSYVDWTNPYVMHTFKLKTEKWHHALLQALEEKDAGWTSLPGNYLDEVFKLLN